MKLNVGASDPRGRYRGAEWINVDGSRFFRTMRVKRFAVANGCMLPFRDRTFEEIHAIHVLEHVPREGHVPFLTEMRRVLTDDGFGFVEVPDFLACCQIIVDNLNRLSGSSVEQQARRMEEIRIRTVGVYGKGRHEGDLHRWGFSPWGMESLFKSVQLAYSRESEMVSSHHKLEPVLLYRVWRERDPGRV